MPDGWHSWIGFCSVATVQMCEFMPVDGLELLRVFADDLGWVVGTIITLAGICICSLCCERWLTGIVC